MADRARGLPMEAGTRLAIASGSKTLTALAGAVPGRGRRARARRPCPQVARCGPARCVARRRHGRAPAVATGQGSVTTSTRTSSGATDDYVAPGVSARPRRPPSPTCRCSRAIRRSSPPGRRSPTATQAFVVLALACRARLRYAVPRLCRPAGPRTGGHARDGVPALGRPARRRGPRLRDSRRSSGAPTSSTFRCAAAATAERSRPWTTCTGCGPPCRAARIVSAGTVAEMRAAAQRARRGRHLLRARPLAQSRRGLPPARRARTPASRSPPCATRAATVTWTVIANAAGAAWPVQRVVDRAMSTVRRGSA